MRFSLEVLRARKGDCLMLHYGTKSQPRLMLIDGGPANVFGPFLDPRIDRLRAARKLAASASLPIDVLMVSHIDDDHIRGILDFTRQLRQQKDAQRPLKVRVASLWHNSFKDLLDAPADVRDASARFGAAALGGEEIAAGVDPDVAMVLASIPQGTALRDDAELLGWKVNPGSSGGVFQASAQGKKLLLDGLEVTVVGPLEAELRALKGAFEEWFEEHRDDPHAGLAAFTDRSIPNLSSLVVLARAGERSILLTGDARGDKILSGLALVGLLSPDAGSTLHVDVLKVPHHGSSNNVTKDFFARVTADHYVFSGDGEHGNPERATLEMLFAARGEERFDLHFTYPIQEIDAGRKVDWNKERAKERARGGKVRPLWSPAKHGLGSLLAKRDPSTIHVVPEAGAHLIELLDPTGP